MTQPPQHLTTWAQRWNVPAQALQELLTAAYDPALPADASEAAVSARVRIEASRAGWRLWRNNVGGGKIDGQFMRWGLANDSAAVNKTVKSADLIGIKPGGQFVSRECKHAGWHYTGTAREVAQLRWIEIVTALGGDAKFTTGQL